MGTAVILILFSFAACVILSVVCVHLRNASQLYLLSCPPVAQCKLQLQWLPMWPPWPHSSPCVSPQHSLPKTLPVHPLVYCPWRLPHIQTCSSLRGSRSSLPVWLLSHYARTSLTSPCSVRMPSSKALSLPLAQQHALSACPLQQPFGKSYLSLTFYLVLCVCFII